MHDSDYDVVAFTVDGRFVSKASSMDCPVVPFEEVGKLYPPGTARHAHHSHPTEAQPRKGPGKYVDAKAKGYRLVNYIASSAIVWPNQEIGDNCYIGPGAVLCPTAKIGNDVFVGDGSIVSHDSELQGHTFLSAGVTLAGATVVEESCFLGTGCTIRDRLTIGEIARSGREPSFSKVSRLTVFCWLSRHRSCPFQAKI